MNSITKISVILVVATIATVATDEYITKKIKRYTLPITVKNSLQMSNSFSNRTY